MNDIEHIGGQFHHISKRGIELELEKIVSHLKLDCNTDSKNPQRD